LVLPVLPFSRMSIKITAINSTEGTAFVNAEAGDKIRLKAGAHAGERGIVEAFEGEKLMIRLDDSGQKVRASPDEVTNFSLAARKAWVTGPDRAVGRRKGTKLCDRVSVTLRLDRDLWEQFLGLEEEGIIANRTGLINKWFRERLAKIDRRGRRS
jgi:hypothetical protein